jgi:hypothetical protein
MLHFCVTGSGVGVRECGCGLMVKEREKRTLQALHVHIYRMHFEDGQVKTIVFRISKIQ